MLLPATAADEARRLVALRGLALLQTPAEERFDRITRIAARLLEVPISLVTLVSATDCYVKSNEGMGEVTAQRDESFSAHTVASNATFVVADAAVDSRFAHNRFVVGEPHLRSYAGEPIRLNGFCVGALCVADYRPRAFSALELDALKDLAGLVEAEFERGKLGETQAALIAESSEFQRKASIDDLTRLWNRNAINDLLARELVRAQGGSGLTLAIIDIDEFKHVNDTYGHTAGDAVLVEVAGRLRRAVREADCLGRYGGEEFLALLGDCEPAAAEIRVRRIVDAISANPISLAQGSIAITVSAGYASYGPAYPTATSLIESADAALYRAKRAGKNRAMF